MAERKPPHSEGQKDRKGSAETKGSSSSQNGQDKYAAPPPGSIVDPSGLTYTIGEKLGKGGFAICYEAVAPILTKRPSKCALKVVKTKMPNKKIEEKFRTELQIHSKMHHVHIVDFHRAFTIGESTFIVLGLCSNGSLKDMCAVRKYLSPPEVRRFAIQICGAMHYMHSRFVIHRDLKMGNIFLDRHMNPKIGDFGLSSLLLHDEQQAIIRRVTFCGTPNYIAPEVLDKGKGHDQNVDMWALGVLLYTLLVGTTPFSKPGDKDQKLVFERVRNCEWSWPDHSFKSVPPEGRDLVEQLLHEDDSKRPSAESVVHHPFFSMPGGIPASIEATAMKRPPPWLDRETMPRQMKASSSQVAPELLIKACGFGSSSRLALFHILYDEEVDGRAPTLPLKTVYEVSKLTETRNEPPKANNKAFSSNKGPVHAKEASDGQSAIATTRRARPSRPTVYMLAPKDSSVVATSSPDLEGILARIKNALRGNSSTDFVSPARPQPLVIRFANYSDQGGIGYVLANGVTGCLISSSKPVKSAVLTNALQRDPSRPPPAFPHHMCRLVPDKVDTDVYLYERDAAGHLRRVTQPYGLFSRSTAAGPSPASSVPSNSSASSSSSAGSAVGSEERAAAQRALFRSHRKLTDALLAQRPGPSRLQTDEPVTALVSRYQRAGNVTIWAWTDHSLQFDFPDHTKLRLTPDGETAAFHHPPMAQPDPSEPLDPAIRVLSGPLKEVPLRELPQQPLRVQPRRPGKAAPKDSLIPKRPAPPPPRTVTLTKARTTQQPSANENADEDQSPVLSASLATMLAAQHPAVAKFHLRAKIKFVYQILDCWRRHGRAGRMGSERLFWAGDGGVDERSMRWATVEL